MRHARNLNKTSKEKSEHFEVRRVNRNTRMYIPYFDVFKRLFSEIRFISEIGGSYILILAPERAYSRVSTLQ